MTIRKLSFKAATLDIVENEKEKIEEAMTHPKKKVGHPKRRLGERNKNPPKEKKKRSMEPLRITYLAATPHPKTKGKEKVIVKNLGFCAY